MTKRINKLIKGKAYVKVHLSDDEDNYITHAEGIIVEQTADLLLMSDTTDFHYDGFTVLRKRDINEIELTDKERFFKKIFDAEGYSAQHIKRYKQLGVKLGTFQNTLDQLKQKGLPVIIECKYGRSALFQIGPVLEVTDKRVRIDHFNARGIFDSKPVTTKLKEITTIKFDAPYANTLFKYVKRDV